VGIVSHDIYLLVLLYSIRESLCNNGKNDSIVTEPVITTRAFFHMISRLEKYCAFVKSF